jgi:hypothetical protein
VVLADAATAVHILPEKGADIRAITDRATGVNLLFEAPWGLAPPNTPPREGWMGDAFLANYEGGWQELLPNTNDRCVIDGVELPFHGEVATLPWTWTAEEDDDAATVTFAVNCHRLPLSLRRRMSVSVDGVRLQERVTNDGHAPCRFTWGHHCVLGPPLVAAGARMEMAPGVVTTPAEPWEDTHRLVPGQRGVWPLASRQGGGSIDLRDIPGPEAGSHDDVLIDDLRTGWAQVVNPGLGLGFRLEWDAGVFPAMVSWQPFGGAREMPLAGAYALGLEPWVFAGTAEAAAGAGRAITLGPGASLETELVACILRGDAAGGLRRR